MVCLPHELLCVHVSAINKQNATTVDCPWCGFMTRLQRPKQQDNVWPSSRGQSNTEQTHGWTLWRSHWQLLNNDDFVIFKPTVPYSTPLYQICTSVRTLNNQHLCEQLNKLLAWYLCYKLTLKHVSVRKEDGLEWCVTFSSLWSRTDMWSPLVFGWSAPCVGFSRPVCVVVARTHVFLCFSP